MLKKSLHFGYLASFLIIAGAFALSLNNTSNVRPTDAPSSVLSETTCGTTSSSINLNVLSPSRMEILFDSQGTTGISRVDIVFFEGGSSERVIGRAVKDNANPQFWRMIWDTKYYKSITSPINGNFRATVHFATGGNCFSTPSPVFNIPANNAPPMPPVEAFINPPQWSSLVNTSTGVFVDFVNLPPDLHQYVIVNWQPQIGYINYPFVREPVYSTGPTAGTGKLRVNIIYSGKSAQAEADIAVYTSSSGSGGSSSSGSGSGSGDSSTSGSGSTTTNTSSGSGSGSTSEPLPEIDDDASLDEIITVLAPKTTEPSALAAPSRAIALVLQSNNEVKSCIESRLTNETLSRILRENRRPNGSEFKTFVRCFEKQRNVVPSILAPVAPEEVKTSKESSSVAIKSLSNKILKSADDTETTALQISGTAAANSDVLLYVFSEPLVLVTTADDDGNWSYTLEDPIEPGEHEVYAMVDRGDGVYERSGVAGFFIGTATASEENPDGLGLELVSEPTIAASNRSTNIYIASTIGIVTFSGVILISYLFFRFRRRDSSYTSAKIDQSDIDNPSNYKNFTDGQ